MVGLHVRSPLWLVTNSKWVRRLALGSSMLSRSAIVWLLDELLSTVFCSLAFHSHSRNAKNEY
jgi:hypothetical protein